IVGRQELELARPVHPAGAPVEPLALELAVARRPPVLLDERDSGPVERRELALVDQGRDAIVAVRRRRVDDDVHLLEVTRGIGAMTPSWKKRLSPTASS